MKRLYKAINEGLKTSLIDFGNNKILKTSNVDINEIERSIIIGKIEKALESYDKIPIDLYNELCKKKYINVYLVKYSYSLNFIVSKFISSFENNDLIINLNWIDLSLLSNTEFYITANPKIPYNIDIQYWNIDKIGLSMFLEQDINKIILPEQITVIDEFAFSGCEKLKNIVIPNNVKTIGDGAFLDCEKLEKVVLSNSIIKINRLAFDHCRNLNNVIIPNGLKIIEGAVFKSCYNLSQLVIPLGVLEIEAWAFDDCNRLSNIVYTGTIDLWKQIKISENAFRKKNVTVYCADGCTKI